MSIRRWRSSPAALLVKVIARIFQGCTGSTATISARRSAFSGVFSIVGKSWRNCSCSGVRPRTVSSRYALPNLIMLAIRLQSTVVFPLPAPAIIRTAPFTRNTARRCISLVLEKKLVSAFRFNVV